MAVPPALLRGAYVRLATVLALVLALTLILTLVCWDGGAHFQGIQPQEDRSLPQKLFNRLYFATSTLSTTGFGDVNATSRPARALVVVFLLLVMANVSGLLEPLLLMKVLAMQQARRVAG